MRASLRYLSIPDLYEIATAHNPTEKCGVCAPLASLGWESLPGNFDTANLLRIGTLRTETETGNEREPTLLEHHPAGTHGWSADAPIAPAFFPYNRCDVWQCKACARPYLRYTEHGGYYHDERIRELRATLIDPAPSTQ